MIQTFSICPKSLSTTTVLVSIPGGGAAARLQRREHERERRDARDGRHRVEHRPGVAVADRGQPERLHAARRRRRVVGSERGLGPGIL